MMNRTRARKRYRAATTKLHLAVGAGSIRSTLRGETWDYLCTVDSGRVLYRLRWYRKSLKMVVCRCQELLLELSEETG